MCTYLIAACDADQSLFRLTFLEHLNDESIYQLLGYICSED